jgi:amidase
LPFWFWYYVIMNAEANNLSCFVPDSFELDATASGILDNKTFAVKDLVAVAGHISSFGHPRWRETHAASETTSPIVSNLLKAGAAMVGLTKLDQLAGSLVGNIGEGDYPVNSLYPDRFTGGSSSGSASAVAGGLADFAIGTDTAGSIRVPATACGLYGLRPTWGTLSSDGVIPWAASFDSVGILSKDPDLIRDVFTTLCESPQNTTQPITKVLLPSDLDMVSSATADVIVDTAHRLARENGAALEEIKFAEFVSQEVGDLFMRLQTREVWKTHAGWLSDNRQYLATDLQARMEAGEKNAAASEADIQADEGRRLNYRQELSKIVVAGSVLVLPVLHDLPPKLNATADEIQEFRSVAVRLNAASGLAGTPEVVLPVRDTEQGLTYGVGLVGSNKSDLSLLDFVS